MASTSGSSLRIDKALLSEWVFRIATLFLVPFLIWLAVSIYDIKTDMSVYRIEHERDLLQMEQRIRTLEPDQEFIDRISKLEQCQRQLELGRECPR